MISPVEPRNPGLSYLDNESGYSFVAVDTIFRTSDHVTCVDFVADRMTSDVTD